MNAVNLSPSEKITTFLIKWTPRAVVVLVAGYYGLGIAYEYGLMALVDKVSMQGLKYFFGYAGIGALMPTAQWYSAMGVRVMIGCSVGVVYDLAEKSLKYGWNRYYEPKAILV